MRTAPRRSRNLTKEPGKGLKIVSIALEVPGQKMHANKAALTTEMP